MRTLPGRTSAFAEVRASTRQSIIFKGGYKKGKNARVQEGKEWAVAIDLDAFFDELPHGLILKLLRRQVADEPFITLIARLLKAGVMVNGKVEKTTKGCPQGSPLSPVRFNIVLNELDLFLHDFTRAFSRA